ncbi:MAG: phosphatase PAP2 family protein [bacterium]
MSRRAPLILAVLALGLAACGSDSGDSSSTDDPVLHWNAVAQRVAGLDHERIPQEEDPRSSGWQFGPTRTSRAFAMVHIAVADAVADLTGAFAPFYPTQRPARPASLDAAVGQAAHDVLAVLYPKQIAALDADLEIFLSAIPTGAAKAHGIAFGAGKASLALAARARDGSEFQTPFQPIEYVYGQEPGEWRADPTTLQLDPLTPDWGAVLPFVMASGVEFRAPPPPALDSAEYAAAFDEVKALGGDGVQTPTLRNQDETEAAIYWAYDGQPFLCAPVKLYNQVAALLARQRRLSTAENARLFGLINVAMADAAIAVWETKYYYNLWRPVGGIREADVGTGPTGKGDGNPDTIGDPTWRPLGSPTDNNGLPLRNFTPPFPAYTSGHAGFGGALFQVLRRFFGRDDLAFTFMSDELNGATVDQNGVVRPRLPRRFLTLSQAEEENGQSRVWLGVHWAFDKTAGLTQGRAVGNLVFDTAFRRRSK